MKEKVKSIIKLLGVGIDELVIDLKIDDVTFNSIEWSEEEDKQKKIYVLLSIIYN